MMTGNAGYPTPRVALTAITSSADTFLVDVQAARGGGVMATVTKNNSRAALEALMREQAAYVQSIAGTNLELLLSSGFLATSTNRARIVLPQPTIKSVVPIQSGKFKVTVNPVPTGRGFEVRYKNGTPEYVSAGVFTSSRILLENMTPGSSYAVEARAIGGLTGYSDWSSPTTCIAM